MMAENPNWWSMQQEQQELPSSSSFLSSTVMPSQYILGSSSPPLSNNSMDDNKELPHSWSQLMGGLSGGCDEYRFGMSHFQQRKVENWEEENNIPHPCMKFPVIDVKKEFSSNQDRGFCGQGGEEFQALRPPLASAAWSPQVLPVSSPRSCVTTSSTSNNILNFSNKADENNQHHHLPDITSESNSTASGGLTKKPRVQASSSQPPLKVRKEKLGDRITALHQLVSPFGKTDTASVLLEAIGYIRFFHGQIEALSSPYMGSASANMRSQQSDNQDTPRNLRSRGLCLVPISSTLQVENDNGADYWAPSFGGGF